MESWIKIIIIICTILILFCRIISGEKFQYLIKFWNIHRYFIYKSGLTINIFNPLNILMFFLRVITISLFISLYLLPKELSEFPLYNFLIISGLMATYIGLKFIIEKIFSVIINYKKTISQIINYEYHINYKIGFKNCFAVNLYFYLLIILFIPISFNLIILTSIISLIIFQIFASYYIFKKIRSNTLNNLIYFILYICTLETAPVFLLFWYAFKF